MKYMKKGKFIVFEGLDGSGKSTQTKMLASYLETKGFKVKKIDFPQYSTKSAGLIEEYLTGKYGTAEEVGPYLASIFYACDRYDASFKIKKWIDDGNFVISDRYIASNMGHQGGKIRDKKERTKYFEWLYNLEYNIFKIPRPDTTIILKTSTQLSLALSSQITDKEKKRKKDFYLEKGKKKDIHENNASHLNWALISYLHAKQIFPKDFTIVECLVKDKLLPKDKIHAKIIKIIDKLL